MIRRLGGAVQFLTVLPVRAGEVSLADSAVFFPLVGAVLGAFASGVYLLLARLLPTPLSSILAILLLVLATGGTYLVLRRGEDSGLAPLRGLPCQRLPRGDG